MVSENELTEMMDNMFHLDNSLISPHAQSDAEFSLNKTQRHSKTLIQSPKDESDEAKTIIKFQHVTPPKNTLRNYQEVISSDDDAIIDSKAYRFNK